jgi:hypothetical protein
MCLDVIVFLIKHKIEVDNCYVYIIIKTNERIPRKNEPI